VRAWWCSGRMQATPGACACTSSRATGWHCAAKPKGRAPSSLARLRPPAWLIATSPPATVTVRALAQREDGDFAIKQQHSCLSAKESCVS